MSSNLKAQPRERLGSRHCRRLRAEGRLPISIQGEGKANADLSIDLAEFLAARRHHESLFDIEVVGGDTETAMVREIQYDSLGEELVHAEFRRVVRGVEIEAEVELVFVGNYRFGVMQPLHTTLAVKAIPSKIPDSIEIQKDRLEVEQFLFAKDLALPEGVSLACEPDFQIAVVASAEGVDVDTEEEDDDDAEPEIIGRQAKPDED